MSHEKDPLVLCFSGVLRSLVSERSPYESELSIGSECEHFWPSTGKRKERSFQNLISQKNYLTCIQIDDIDYHLISLTPVMTEWYTFNIASPHILKPLIIGPLYKPLGCYQSNVQVFILDLSWCWMHPYWVSGLYNTFLNPKDVSQHLYLRHYKRMDIMMSF